MNIYDGQVIITFLDRIFIWNVHGENEVFLLLQWGLLTSTTIHIYQQQDLHFDIIAMKL